MRTEYKFIFFVLFTSIAFAQNTKLDLKIAKQKFTNQNYKGLIEEYSNIKYNSNIEVLELIAKCYNKLEDYYKEIEYYEKLTQLNDEAKNYHSLIFNYIELAKAYKKLRTKESYLKGIDLLKKALQLSKVISIKPSTKFSIYNNIANYYSHLEDIKNGTKNYKKALIIAKKEQDNKTIAMVYLNLSRLTIKVNATKEELKSAEKYIELAKKHAPLAYPVLYSNLGIINYLLGDYVEAIRNHDRAINLILKRKTLTKNELIDFKTINKCKRKEELLNYLFEKTFALIKLAEKENNKQFLVEALNTIELTDKILDLLFIETTEEKTKVYWRGRATKFYFLGIHISHLLNNSKKAFYFAEKNKALLLLNNTSINKLNSNIKLPDSIKNKEIDLKKEIYALENLVEKGNKIDSIKSKLFDKKLELQSFSNSLKKSFPKYIENKNNLTKIISIKEVQNKIKDTNNCYINYTWDKTENQFDALYGIAITKHKVISFKINDLKSFNIKVKKYREAISKPFTNNEEKNNYQKLAFSLYKDLFPKEIKPLINKRKLIIIPDSDLSNIPFEALITNNDNNLLINSNEISYAYSLSFLLENNTLNRNPKKDFIGFAPQTFNYDNLKTLPNSLSEINTASNLTNGNTFIKKEATKDIFFSNLNDYKIIHLSTHANANDSIAPWIAFKNEKLYLNELYTTKNQADLVVLSACNSSLGKLKDGEGVFSLARGFFYSGSKSVISSLWNVNDKSNATITTSFYTYLKNGKTKSAALRLAKLDYLNTHSLSEVSPYYWSSLVLIGDNSAIEFNNNYLSYIVLTILLLFILFFLLKKLKTVGNI